MSANVHQGLVARQEALTAASYAELCEDRVWHGRAIPVHVQARIHGLVQCARVAEVKPGVKGTDWFRLDAGAGPQWVPHANVRACAGNGHCGCEAGAAELDARSAAGAAASAVPLGNTGTTTGAGA